MAPAYHIASDDGLISIQVGSDIDLADLYELAKSVVSSADYDPAFLLTFFHRGSPIIPEILPVKAVRLYTWNSRSSGVGLSAFSYWKILYRNSIFRV